MAPLWSWAGPSPSRLGGHVFAMQLEAHWMLWQSPMFLQQLNKSLCLLRTHCCWARLVSKAASTGSLDPAEGLPMSPGMSGPRLPRLSSTWCGTWADRSHVSWRTRGLLWSQSWRMSLRSPEDWPPTNNWFFSAVGSQRQPHLHLPKNLKQASPDHTSLC